jgi:putative hydrolase of the HAD superfamily
MIKNLIFDLGNVLVKVHFDKFKKDLIDYGMSVKTIEELLNRTDLMDKLESGSMKFDEFYEISSIILDKKISKSKFRQIFNDIFTEIPGINELLKELYESKKYIIILLSNTNNQHFNYIKNKFNYLKYFNKFALSYRLKLLKPDITIYKKVLSLYRLKPEETLFIDDLENNCDAAEKAGIKSINFKDFESFKKLLIKLI